MASLYCRYDQEEVASFSTLLCSHLLSLRSISQDMDRPAVREGGLGPVAFPYSSDALSSQLRHGYHSLPTYPVPLTQSPLECSSREALDLSELSSKAKKPQTYGLASHAYAPPISGQRVAQRFL